MIYGSVPSRFERHGAPSEGGDLDWKATLAAQDSSAEREAGDAGRSERLAGLASRAEMAVSDAGWDETLTELARAEADRRAAHRSVAEATMEPGTLADRWHRTSFSDVSSAPPSEHPPPLAEILGPFSVTINAGARWLQQPSVRRTRQWFDIQLSWDVLAFLRIRADAFRSRTEPAFGGLLSAPDEAMGWGLGQRGPTP